MTTGAVVAGRGTFDPAGGWGGDHHDGVPIFILTRREPDSDKRWPLVTYVSDIETAMREAKQAAGEKNVLVHGAESRSSRWPPACWTRSRSTSFRCCSGRAAACSTTSVRSRSS